MNNHFAASWLKSLSTKLEALPESSWVADKAAGLSSHRNLFKEFFSPNFQKTLACVGAEKKVEFIRCIEKNLYKFEDRTQQFPLTCLCALFEHGKESTQTKQKVEAWASFLLSRLKVLQTVGVDENSMKGVLLEVVEECRAAHFQKFVSVMGEQLQESLADALGEYLRILPEDDLKSIFEEIGFLVGRVEKLVDDSMLELNDWLRSAPEYPCTPMALVKAYARLSQPLLTHYKRIKDTQKKESFLISAALTFQGLNKQFNWMCKVEPDLVPMSLELQKIFFTRTLQGYAQPVNIIEPWLPKRRETYNTDFEKRILEVDAVRMESLKLVILPHFPERVDGGASDWVPFFEPSALQDTILKWFTQHLQGFFCPRHTLYPKSLAALFRRLGRTFEVDLEGRKVRLADPRLNVLPPMPPPPPLAASSGPQVVPPPGARPAQSTPAALAVAPILGQPTATPLNSEVAGGAAPEIDNLVDFLLNEALQPVPPATRNLVKKLSHGVYRFGDKEVTLHTKNGHLFVYRVGDAVQHTPIKNFIETEFMPGTATVDKSAVEKIAAQSAQISTGATLVTPVPPAPNMPFGINKPAPEQVTDPETLMSKRVQAATHADELNRQAVRRLFPNLDFQDEVTLRKLLGKGLKKDPTWAEAYKTYCNMHNMSANPKAQTKQFITNFLERHLVNWEQQEWLQKFMEGMTPQGAAKKEKKKEKKKAKKEGKEDKKKDKDKKGDKKRKAASQSSSSDDEGEQQQAAKVATAIFVPVVPAPAPQAGFNGCAW
mmetsp:Transcript_31611/g.73733  ORF Transcript_31611/g.73733 Transcript_31611/m.73733 type:complete len:772 (-) Transcript_31611:69-2384(-)